MTWRRKIAKIVGAAVVVTGVIGFLSGKVEAKDSGLSTKDMTTIGEEIAKADLDSAEVVKLNQGMRVLYGESTRLDSSVVKVENRLKKIKKDSLGILHFRYAVDTLFEELETSFSTYATYIKIANKLGLDLRETYQFFENLNDDLNKAIFEFIKKSIKVWDKQENLSRSDIDNLVYLVGILEDIDERFYSGKEARGLIADLNMLRYKLDKKTTKALEGDITKWKKKDVLEWEDKKKIDEYLIILKDLDPKYNKKKKTNSRIGTLYSLLAKVGGLSKKFPR